MKQTMLFCRQLLLPILSFFFVAPVYAQSIDSAFTIKESKDFFPLNRVSFFLKDTSGKLKIDQVTKLKSDFAPLKDEIYNLRNDENVKAYWIKCNIQNLTSTQLKYLLCFHSGIDSVETYVFHPDSTFDHSLIRSLQATRTRPLFISQALSIPISFQQGVTQLYVRVASRSLWSREMGSIIISLAEEKSFINYFLEVRFYQGLILGMLILIFLFHIFVYFFFKDITYLVFFINIFFTLLYLLLRKNYQMELDFLAPFFSIISYLHDPVGVLISVTAIWFSQSFLNTRQTDPSMHKIMNVLMIFLGAVFVSMIFLQFLTLMNFLSIVFGFVSALAVIVASIRSYRKGNRLALYVFFGFVLLAAVPLIYIVPIPNYLHFRTSESDFHYLGEAVRSIIFAIGIADRFYQLKRDIVRVEMEKKQLKFEKEKQLQDEKERISRDLHDNIGSQMAVLSLELGNPSLTSVNNSHIAAARENIQHLIVQLRDTVWALESNEVSFEDVENRLSAMIFSFRKKINGIEFKLDMPVKIKSLSLKPSQAVNLYRIIQEAVQNAMRHSNGSMIHILFSHDERVKNFTVRIIDDGIGFKLNGNLVDGENHYGVKNMKKRALELNGNFEIKSGETKGTVAELSFPYSQV